MVEIRFMERRLRKILYNNNYFFWQLIILIKIWETGMHSHCGISVSAFAN